MSSIGNLKKEIELLVVSSRLQSVATGLKKIINKRQVDKIEEENFDWVRNLTGQMDWNSEHYHKKEHPELCVIATELRPLFYKALLKSRIKFNPKFSEGIYEILKSYGRKVLLSQDSLEQTYQIYQTMATDILTGLSYDGRV